MRNAHCTYYEGQTGLCKAKEFVKCNPVNCKLYTIDELSTIVDLQEQLKAKEQECENLKKQFNDLLNKPEIQDKILWKIDNEALLGSKDAWIYKLEQTLINIKEIAEPYKMTVKKICGNCKKYDDCHACCYKDINCYKYTSSKTNACEEFTYLDEFVPNILENNILQKISECEVKNDR